MYTINIINAAKDGVSIPYQAVSEADSQRLILELNRVLGVGVVELANRFLHGQIPPDWKLSNKGVYEFIANNKTIQNYSSLLIIWPNLVIDKIDVRVLTNYFDYIWYESRDDCFFASQDWSFVFFVRHDGTVIICDCNTTSNIQL